METLAHPLLCFMGPSASGKTFISEKLLGKEQKVITTTTRKKRPKEVGGQDYYFLSRANFEKLLAEDAFYETDTYVGHYYGTQKAEIRRKTAAKTAFAIVTVPGYYALAKQITPLIPIYLQISQSAFAERLAARHLPDDEVKKRTAEFAREAVALVELQKNVPGLLVVNNNRPPQKTLAELSQKLANYL